MKQEVMFEGRGRNEKLGRLNHDVDDQIGVPSTAMGAKGTVCGGGGDNN
jgi:hypothetical protein